MNPKPLTPAMVRLILKVCEGDRRCTQGELYYFCIQQGRWLIELRRAREEAKNGTETHPEGAHRASTS